jgi:hypothetical protein
MKKKSFKVCFTVLCSFILIGLSSCKKEAESIGNTLSPMSTLLEKMNKIKDTKGGGVVISTGQIYTKNPDNPQKRNVSSYGYQIHGFFDNLPFESIQVGDVKLIPYQTLLLPGEFSNQYIPQDDDRLAFKGLFGKKVNITYKAKNAALDVRSEYSVDAPAQLDVNVPDNTGGSGTTSSSNFYRSVPITWNAGNPNDKVYILFSFEPQLVTNERFRSYSAVSKFYEVPDNGSYTLGSSNFQGLPDGANVVIIVARGTTAIGAGITNGYGTSIQAISTAGISGQVGTGGGGGGGNGGPGIYVL